MYNALIMGAGQIAGGYDNPETTAILTHAHAYKEHKDINLLGFYDINFSNALKMAEKWNCNAFKTLEEVSDIDIISICTPDEFHLSSLKQALKLKPKLIFLEKPLSNNINEANKILEISKTIPILVNYSRRFVKEFQDLAQKAKDNLWGEFETGNGYYCKGFVHNGSHMTNLVNLFLGPIKKTADICEFNDFYEKDPTKSVVFSANNGNKFFMQGTNCNNFTMFEIDLIFQKSRIRILEAGKKIELYSIKENEQYKGYFNLVLKETLKTELDFALLNAIDNIHSYLTNGEPLKSTVQQALEAINYG